MRLIDADTLKDKVLKWMPSDPCGIAEKEYPIETDIVVSLIMEIDQAPTIDADRPQGEWKPFDLTWGRSIYACSACEEAIVVPCGWSDGKPIYDYCPLCGARMKGADDE